MLTVRAALQLEALKGCRIIGGESGLDRLITSVNQMDAPDFVNWTKENQFIVTTGYFIRNDVNEQKQLIIDLNEKKCAGLGIKVRRFFRTIPQHMIDLADREGIPLIEISHEDNISEIMNEIMREILVRQARKIERSHEIHDRFTEVALTGGGLNEIAELLSGFVHNSVSICDTNWKNIGIFECANSNIPLSALLPLEYPVDMGLIQKNLDQGKKFLEINIILNEQTIKRIIYPIMHNKRLYGYITIWENLTQISDLDIVAVEHAATVAGLELLRNKAFSEMRSRMKNDFFNDFLNGQIKSREILAKRGSAFGINSNQEYVCMVLDVDNFTKLYLENFSGSESQAENLKRRLGVLVDEVIADNNVKAVSYCQSDQVVILLQKNVHEPGMRESTKQLASEIKNHIYKNTSGFTISIGIGVLKEALYVHESYASAMEAIKIGSKLKLKKDSLLYFDDFFIEHLLSSMDLSRLKILYLDTIAKLEEFDERNKMDLVKSLSTYFQCNYNLSEAAKEMYIHRNTLTYRLDKIKEILNIDINKYNNLLKLQLALKLKDFLQDE